MVIHPREHDLVMGTFGRSFLVLDDIRPLRTLASDGAPERLHVYPAFDADQVVIDQQPGTVFPGDFLYQGENRDFGARIRYWVPAGDDDEARDESDDEGGDETGEGAGEEGRDGDEDVTVRILSSGVSVRRLTGSAEAGVQQVEWRMDRAGVRGLTSAAPDDPDDAREPGGPLALPGDYVVQVILGADTVETALQLLPDPRMPFDAATARRVDALQDRLLEARREATRAADDIRDARKTVERIQEMLDDRDGEAADSLSAHGDRIDEGLDSLYFAMAGEPIQGFRNQPELLNSRLGAASRDLGGGRWAEPSQAAMRSLERAEAAVAEMSARVEAFFATRWAEYRSAVEASGIGLFDGGP